MIALGEEQRHVGQAASLPVSVSGDAQKIHQPSRGVYSHGLTSSVQISVQTNKRAETRWDQSGSTPDPTYRWASWQLALRPRPAPRITSITRLSDRVSAF
jgi:hypothetical protein